MCDVCDEGDSGAIALAIVDQEAGRDGVEANLLCDLGAQNSGGSTSDSEQDVDLRRNPMEVEPFPRTTRYHCLSIKLERSFLAFRQRNVLNERL